MAVVTIDSYSSDNIDTAIGIYSNASAFGAVGQAFTCSSSYSVQSVTFYLKRYGSPTGTISAAIYAHTGTYGTTSKPTGSHICVSSTTVEASDVGTSSYVGWKFYFTTSENRQLSPNTKYVAVVSYSNGDGNNFIYVGVDNSSPTHSGNSSVLSGTTWYQGSADAAFIVLGDETGPTVTTQAASSVTHNSATGNGNITATGGAAVSRRGFCYKAGTSGDPTVSDSTVYDDGTFSTGTYSKGITGLSASTGYRVRAYAVNSIGTSYGSTVQVTTSGADAPVVSTTTTSRLDRKCVIFGGNVTSQGTEAVTERGVYYGTDEFSQTNKLVSSGGTGTYSIFLSGLTPNTKYYYKAFATSSIGTSYGDVLNFTTGNSLAVNDKTALPPFNRA